MSQGVKCLSLARKILIVFVLAVISYIASTGLFSSLKAKGYSGLFNSNKPYDLVIKHAFIIDGTGEKAKFRGDIAISKGNIAAVGTIDPIDTPIFDAGGLVVIPAPYPFHKSDSALEHVLASCYPRYRAQDIYFQNEPYQGLNLEQVAEDLGLTVAEAFNVLKDSLGPKAKVYLTNFPKQEEITTMEEYLARLTGYRANYSNKTGQGVIKEGATADLYFFLSKDFDDETLTELFKKGKTPTPLFTMKDGKFVN